MPLRAPEPAPKFPPLPPPARLEGSPPTTLPGGCGASCDEGAPALLLPGFPGMLGVDAVLDDMTLGSGGKVGWT